jgi:tryptophan-rich sensory protein
MSTYNKEWYNGLDKSSITPPSIVFPIVWTALYISIIISFLLFILQDGLSDRMAITFFIIQMVLNLLWTPVFFRLHMIKLSLFIVILMWIFILLTILRFTKKVPIAGYLLIPYLIWVSLAIYLNGYIYYNN